MLKAAETQPGWLRALSALGIPQRPALMAVSVAGLSCLYVLYAYLVNPLVQVRSVTPVGDRGGQFTPAPPQLVMMASQHLPSQPWAANASIQFRTRDAYVYSEKWEQVESDQAVRFTPFAMVWVENEEDDEPIALWCRSAIVRFADAFDRSNPRPTRVVGGSLQGDVELTGPRGLKVVGRNFEFSEKSSAIWSDHQVEFAYDGHRGSAHGVQIELLTDSEPDSESTLSIVGLSKIQLRQNVVMDLAFDESFRNGAKPSPDTAEAAEAATAEPDEAVRVQVRSAGSFEFFVDTNLATFSKDVRVYRPTGQEQYDSLQCDLLTLVFQPLDAPETETANANGAEQASDALSEKDTEFRGVDANLTFQRMRAQGQRVVLVSDANEFTAHMSDFIYDAQSRVAALTHGQFVRVMHRSSELHSPEITIVHDEHGQVTSSWCRGAGWLRHHDAETGEVVLAGQWARQLVRFRETETGLDVIEFDQQAVIQHPLQKVGLAAESIKIWLADLQQDSQTDSNAQPRVQSQSNRPVRETSNPSTSGSRYQPRRLLAHTKVAIASPQFQGETERLEIWFEPAESAGVAETSGDSSPTHGPAAPTADGSGGRGAADPQQPDDRKNSGFPLEVLSDLIRVRVQLGAALQDDLLVTDIVSEGHVDIRQRHEDGSAPLRLTGQRLKLHNEDSNRQVLHVFGHRAHIRDRDLHIEGEEIHFDRARNLAWVSGAGLLQLPVDQDFEGEELAEPQVLDVLWSEQMTFDGQTGRFFGNVRTVLADNQMQCQEMHVLLTRKLSFSEGDAFRNRQADATQQRPAADLHSIVCNDRVEFRGYEYEDRKLVAIRHARCAHVSLNQVTGIAQASGPGTITVWQRRKARRGSLSPSATARANQPLESRDSEWEYTKVEFVGKADGNLKQRFTTFHDQVRIVYGPVDRPDGVIDPENLPGGEFPENSGLMRCDELQVTQHTRDPQHPAHVELLATGNAILEGQTFHAQADTISYDESKEQYVLRSIEPRKATIWVQETPASKPSSAQGQSIKFSPVHKQLKVDRATGFQGVR